MKYFALVLAGLLAACYGTTKSFTPTGSATQSADISDVAPHLKIVNDWNAETQVISYTNPGSGCPYPMSPLHFSIWPGQSVHMEKTNPCMDNPAVKTFVQVEPAFVPYSCTVGIRAGAKGHWHFGFFGKLKGPGSACTLTTHWNRAVLHYNVRTPDKPGDVVGGGPPRNKRSSEVMTNPLSAVLWQIGDSYKLADEGDGQCGVPLITSPGPIATFTLTQGTNGEGVTCYRNQLNPQNGSDVYRLTDGNTYEWDFQTVTHMGIDTAALSQRLVWQIHQYVCGLSPNTILGIENNSGGEYGQTWYLISGNGNKVDLPYTEGATDTWKIVALISDGSNGSEQVWRNGSEVFSSTGPTFACGTMPFWNWGPYMWDWKGQNGVISSLNQVKIIFNYMNLSQVGS